MDTARRRFELGAEDRVLQFASISFDTAGEKIYPTLTSGATLVMRTEEMLGVATTFLRACREQGVTVLDLPTTYWHQLASELDEAAAGQTKGLRLVIIGGERAMPEQ